MIKAQWNKQKDELSMQEILAKKNRVNKEFWMFPHLEQTKKKEKSSMALFD